MDKHELSEIQNLPAAELIERIGAEPAALAADDLAALRDLEAGAKEPRADVLAALDAAAARTPPADDRKPGKARAVKAATAPDAPAWQADDYTGPLDIEQAAWRRHNIKPVQAAKTK